MRFIVSHWVPLTLLALALLAVSSCTPALTTPPALPTSIATPTAAPSATVPAMPVPSATPVAPAVATVPPLPFVKVNGLGLAVGNQPFRFIGANAPNFGFYREYGYSIDQAIQSAKASGISVLRIYLGYGKGTWSDKPFE